MRLTVTQEQKGDGLIPTAFNLPMEVEFTIAETKQREKLNVTKRVETFAFDLASQPSAINIDPDEKIPLKTVKIGGVTAN